MTTRIALLAFAFFCGGCLGNGALLQDTFCKGKATIVGGGSGFSGINGTIDCGDGFTFVSGTKGSQTIVQPPPAPPGEPPVVNVPVKIVPQTLAPVKP